MATCKTPDNPLSDPVHGDWSCDTCDYKVPIADEEFLLSTGEGDDRCECGGTFTRGPDADLPF